MFVHGWMCDRSAWAPQVADLAADHRCLSVDLRGRGDSPVQPPYDMLTAAEDLAALMRARGLGPAIVAGHSLGGFTALLLNRLAPELVAGMVFCDSPLQPDALEWFVQVASRLTEAGSLEPARELVERFFGPETSQALQAEVRTMVLNGPLEVAVGMLDTSRYPASLDELLREADEKPCMATWASEPAPDLRWIRQVTRFIRHEPVAGAGHFLQLEQPAVTNALLRAFVDDVRRDPRPAARKRS